MSRTNVIDRSARRDTRLVIGGALTALKRQGHARARTHQRTVLREVQLDGDAEVDFAVFPITGHDVS